MNAYIVSKMGDLPVFGLNNSTAVCYLNSLLQCLFSTNSLNLKVLGEVNLIEKYKKENKMHIASYINLVNTIASHEGLNKGGSNLKVNPKAFVNVFVNESRNFSQHQQQDADEFLTTLLDTFHEQLKKERDPTNDLQSLDPQTDQCFMYYINAYKPGFSYITPMFHSQLRTKTFCTNCKHVNKRYDIITQLHLELPENVQLCTLYDCLDLFTRKEQLEDYKCDNCKSVGSTWKTIRPSIISTHFIIVLKRFKFPNKVRIPVKVPLHELDINRYISNSDKQAFQKVFDSSNFQYNLYASVFHFGRLDVGHYFSMSKRKEKWYRFNDERISLAGEVKEEDFNQAYILFFRKEAKSDMRQSRMSDEQGRLVKD